MNARLVLNTQEILRRFDARYQRAQKWLDNEVLKDCDPYVPFLQGDLVKSGIHGTKIGSGLIVYNAPYARAQYYLYPRKTRDHHPDACTQWFEKAKAVNLNKWVKGANDLVTGRAD